LLSANQKETVDKNLYLAMQAQVDEALEKCKTAQSKFGASKKKVSGLFSMTKIHV
jgi:hypothetical protein